MFHFRSVPGPTVWLYILGALVASAVLFFALQAMPARFRKPLVAVVTFLAGLFYAVEFFWPVDAKNNNFLTPWIDPVAQLTQVLQSFALGLGVYSLVLIHLRAVTRQRSGWGFSAVLMVAFVAMTTVGILSAYHPNRYNKAFVDFLFQGGLQNLNATMFSIIAFYIVSAAYRAFRIRSVEATILLAAAFIVMIGAVALGQAITNPIPNHDFYANFRVENMRNWILTKVNAPALQAVDFGIGIGALATSLRLWLSLERGSYFEKEL